jgi:uncharacterized protein with NRDE domain
MCLMVVLRRVHPAFPVVVAANRDEAYARPTAPPGALWPGVAGGRDLVAGGTWLGVRRDGFFAGLTNQRQRGMADPTRRSRGEIVTGLLTAADPVAWLSSIDPADYNPFNAIFGSAEDLRVAYGRPGGLRIDAVPDGIHALPTDVLDAPGVFKVGRSVALAADVATRPWPALADALRAVLADHMPPEALPPDSPFPPEVTRKLEAICIHTPVYGTRSATLLALAPGRVAHYHHAEGPPCTAPFADYTSLLG